MSNYVESPVTGGKTELIRTLSKAKIVGLYPKDQEFDPSPFIPVDQIEHRRCLDTGYEFFYPHKVAGTPEYYVAYYGTPEELAGNFNTNSWEFRTVREMVTEANNVLDVGCGGGEFIASLSGLVESAKGLETSEYGRKNWELYTLDVDQKTIEEYSQVTGAVHDVVTSFQVLEHVPNVKNFIENCLKVLKPGGRLILVVPNNDGFLSRIPNLVSNIPPHHIGWWKKASLHCLGETFGLKVLLTEYEPLQERNLGIYQSTMERQYLPKFRLARSLYYRLGLNRYFRTYLQENRETIQGGSILCVYEKPR